MSDQSARKSDNQKLRLAFRQPTRPHTYNNKCQKDGITKNTSVFPRNDTCIYINIDNNVSSN